MYISLVALFVYTHGRIMADGTGSFGSTYTTRINIDNTTTDRYNVTREFSRRFSVLVSRRILPFTGRRV